MYMRGVDKTIPFETGMLAIKAIRDTDDVIVPYNETVKVKVNEYNRKLAVERKAWKGEKDEFNVSDELQDEFVALQEEIETSGTKPIEVQFSDDKYKALVSVCDVAVKAAYEAIQSANTADERKKPKDERVTPPSTSDFNLFYEFVSDDLANAEKQE